MSTNEATQKIILAVLAAAAVILLGPYLGLAIFGRASIDSRTAPREATEGYSTKSVADSASRSKDFELEMPGETPSQERKAIINNQEDLADIDDLLTR